LVLAKPVLAYYAAFYNLPVDQLQIDWQLMLASILSPIVLLMATASFVILRAIRLPPLALIRGYSRKPKAMKLEKLIHFRNARFETKFRVRQSVRSIGKLLVAMLGMAFATMLTLTGFLVQDSYTYLMEQGVKGTFRYDQNYVFKVLQDDNDYGGEPYQMLAVSEMGSHEAIVVFGLTANGKLLHLADQQGQVIDLSSRTMNRLGTGVKTGVISRVLADRLKLNVGNTLSLIDNIENKIYFVRVGAIAENYTQLAIYLPIDVFNDLFDLPEGRFKGIFSDQVLEIDSEDLVMNQQMDDVLTSFETYAGMIKMMLLGLGFLSSAMALLILYILIALLIEENSRSIALLKILGYDSREIRNLILRTLNLPVLVGFALGIPLLFSLYGRMLESSFAEIDMTMPLILSPKYMVAGFALLYATYLLTRKITGRKIFKISMTDGLKSMQE
jgi:putative ABC transport system permease protein